LIFHGVFFLKINGEAKGKRFLMHMGYLETDRLHDIFRILLTVMTMFNCIF